MSFVLIALWIAGDIDYLMEDFLEASSPPSEVTVMMFSSGSILPVALIDYIFIKALLFFILNGLILLVL